MPKFGFFVSYLENPRTGSWGKLSPLVLEVATEEAASQMASKVADAIAVATNGECLIQITGPESGRVIGEIRRPFSN